MTGVRPRLRFALSFPERLVRSLTAAAGGTVHETAQILLPRLIRRSRFYEATAKNLLRVAIELVGGVEGTTPATPTAASGVPTGDTVGAKELAWRKGAGNVVELGSIAAFGFSPLWLLAGASDIARGSRVYLDALVGELKNAGVLALELEIGSVDELLGVFERGTGRTASLIDIPPVELAELRRSFAELAAEREALPSPQELAALYAGLQRTAEDENRSLLEVSQGIGMAFLVSARDVSRDHLVIPYREDWQPLWREGFGAYAARVSAPYRRAVAEHFDPDRPTWTERALGRLSRDV
jgi:hypothetical protein